MTYDIRKRKGKIREKQFNDRNRFVEIRFFTSERKMDRMENRINNQSNQFGFYQSLKT